MTFYVDVSHYRPVINWELAKQNCPFLISKATQGTDYMDETLENFIQGCEKKEIPYWLYSFLNNGGELEQAEYLVNVCRQKTGRYFVGYILDVESQNAEENVKSALNYLTGLGRKTMLYTGYAQYSRYRTLIETRPESCAWWESRYGLNNGEYNSAYPCHAGADLHQYTSQGNCPGITECCDLNRLTGQKAESWFTDIPQSDMVTDPDGAVRNDTGMMQERGDHFGSISYRVHVREKGWLNWRCDGEMAGSTGQNRRIEAMQFRVSGQVDVSVHVRDQGDRTYKNITENTMIGTTGEKRRLESLMIQSADTVYLYRVHRKGEGWSGWRVNGQWAGEKGKERQIEAVEIKDADIAYCGHVQNSGDGIWYADGMTCGTTGKGLRLEAIRIKSQHLGEIEAQAHIQGRGWVDYGKINADTVIGSTGQGLRLECLRLKGNFEWRAHLQDTGWTTWTVADGVATLGAVGKGLRMEAIEMRKKS